MSRFSPEATTTAQANQATSICDTGFHVVQFVVAAVLLLAAGLKGHQLATEPVPETSLLTSRWFLIAAVEIELLLGLWLLFGVYARLSWSVALACFVTFAHVALYKLLTGETSCGCFGRVEVSPLWTLLMDVVIVAALLWYPPRKSSAETAAHPTMRRWASGSVALPIAAFLAVGIPEGIVMATYNPARLSDDGLVVGDSNFVFLEPETWFGKEFPLLGHIDIGERLRHGKWIVVLYHHDCPRCQELLPQYEQVANETIGREGRIALVEIPPYETNGELVRSQCAKGRLSDEKEWFVRTPVELFIQVGKVERVSVGSGVGYGTVALARWNDP